MSEPPIGSARRRAITVTVMPETQAQARVRAFADDFRLLAAVCPGLVLLIPPMHRVRRDRA